MNLHAIGIDLCSLSRMLMPDQQPGARPSGTIALESGVYCLKKPARKHSNLAA
jgi:hypothetical protein